MKKASKESSIKISFGKRRDGQHRKSKKPKGGKSKKYRGQGR